VKLKKAHPFARFGALILMAAYLFIVSAHLFFAPNFREKPTVNYKAAFKRNTEAIYYLIRNDRSTFSENKTVKTFAKNISLFSVSLLDNTRLLLAKSTVGACSFQFLPDHHHSYLSNHVIRI
jgi:hypothetical protein